MTLGEEGEFTLYIGSSNTDVSDYLEQHITTLSLNEVERTSIVLSPAHAYSSVIKEGEVFKLLFGKKLVMKGVITKLEKGKDSWKITGLGLAEAFKRRQIPNRTTFDFSSGASSSSIFNKLCSVKGDGLSPWIIEPGTVEDYGTLFIKFEPSSRLSAIGYLTESCVNPNTLTKYDWYVSHGADPYDTDRINFVAYRGSTTSVYTFYMNGANENAVETQNIVDKDEMVNSSIVLGYGDGAQQLLSRDYLSSTKRTYLSQDLDATSTTIYVDDTSGFAAGDKVWIGCELITIGAIGTGSFTGCTRAVGWRGGRKPDGWTDNSQGYFHSKGRAVTLYYDDSEGVYYTEENEDATHYPETGSSIADNGLYQMSQAMLSIKNQDELDRISQGIVDRHSQLYRVLKVSAFEPYEAFQSIDLGDKVTVEDEDTEISGTFRVVSINIGMKSNGDAFFELTLDNKKIDFISEYYASKKTIEQSAQYKTIYDPGHSHADGTYTTPSHDHTSGTYGTDTRGAMTAYGYYYGLYTDSITTFGSWQSASNSISTGTYEYFHHGIFGSFKLEGDAGTGYSWLCEVKVRAYNSTLGEYWPSISGITLTDGFNAEGRFTFIIPFYIHIPKSWYNDTYELQYYVETNSYLTGYEIRYCYWGSKGHLHDVTGDSGTKAAMSISGDSSDAYTNLTG